MKILSVNIHESIASTKGLEAITMKKIPQIVLLAGKNGSGKTRFLSLIKERLRSKPDKESVIIDKKNIQNIKEANEQMEKDINTAQNNLSRETDPNKIKEIKHYINTIENAIKRNIGDIRSRNNNIIINNLFELSDDLFTTVIEFVPKNIELTNPYKFTLDRRDQTIRQAINNKDLKDLNNITLAYIQYLQDNWFEATHQFSEDSAAFKDKSIQKYEDLKKLISVILNTEIGRKEKKTTLFNFQLDETQLSEGQKILLQFCIALYTKGVNIKDSILIMDEPENHLHPSVIIEIIDRISEIIGNGQIWIATHSIPLLAHFDPSQIWFVDNNSIEYAGKTPEKVLQSLIGDENEISKLLNFISLPAQYATSRFAFECLLPPPVINTESDDPQVMQIREILKNINSSNHLKILDYGAGKGRVISNLFDYDKGNQENLIQYLDYIAFDPDKKDKDFCIESIKRVYKNIDKRYYNAIDDSLIDHDPGSFNVILMCNVLHEIDPIEWLSLFSSSNPLMKLLDKNGYLLIVEDHRLPKGEKAYQKGFLVLETTQIKELFKITSTDINFKFLNKDDRLKAHLIPANCLIRIDKDSRLDSLKSLREYSMQKVKEIRREEPNYKNGNIHGYWIQQLANVSLAISELTNPE